MRRAASRRGERSAVDASRHLSGGLYSFYEVCVRAARILQYGASVAQPEGDASVCRRVDVLVPIELERMRRLAIEVRMRHRSAWRELATAEVVPNRDCFQHALLRQTDERL